MRFRSTRKADTNLPIIRQTLQQLHHRRRPDTFRTTTRERGSIVVRDRHNREVATTKRLSHP